VVPHVTDEIKGKILALASGVDVAIVEIGGTVGDIESLPFLEAIRQLRHDLGRENCLYVHLTLLPYIATAHEVKTKPTQHSVNKLREIGIQADILLCRSDRPVLAELKGKIALFCNVDKDAVISAEDVKCIYEVPLVFHREGLDDKIVKLLNIWTRAPKLDQWEAIVKKISAPKNEVTIAIAGKYVNLQDSYKSLHESLVHGGLANNCRVNLTYVDSEEIEKKGAVAMLGDADGILIPGGFGSRGVEGKISAIKYARENNIPFFGICLGMQLAMIEMSRNLCGLKDANSSEFDAGTQNPVVDIMEGQKSVNAKGGTMRLGAYPCVVKKGTAAYTAYGTTEISERHRHRFEVNNKYRDTLQKAGVEFSGLSPDSSLVEMLEYKNHAWFLGCQFHPEYRSRPMLPHPLFASFIEATALAAKQSEWSRKKQEAVAEPVVKSVTKARKNSLQK
jgi:CTP synthase